VNIKKIILVFLLFISLNAFSQNERGIGNITRDSLRDCSLDLIEAKDQINLLQNYIKEIRAPHSEKDSSILLNTGKYYALIIAVQDYQNYRNFPKLNYTIRDGKALEKVLLEHYLFDEVYTLYDPTKEAIDLQFQGLQIEVKENDNVLIFYAGHGYKWDKPGKNLTQGYWCPVDAEWESTATIINNSQILYNLQVLDSRNTLLISDACFAGSIGDNRELRPKQSDVLQEVYNIQSCQYFSSGANTTVPDQSIFMKNLLKALKDNTKKYLKATDLFYTTDVKNSYIRSKGSVVTPKFSPLIEAGHIGGGDFIFIKK